MAGFSSNTNGSGVVFAKNVDFSGQSIPGNTITTNGQLIIGSTATNAGGTHINVGRLTSPAHTITIGYSSPNITLDVNGALVLETLTPDSGGAISPIGGNINIFGQTSNTSASQVMQTTQTPAGTMKVENRAYITSYVVDYNTTIGMRGTYSTIQAAVNAAVADSTSQTGTIYIRAGNYSGNVAIPNAAKLSFVAFDPLYTISSGLWTFGTGCAVQFTGILFNAPSGSTSLTIPNDTLCTFLNCLLTGVDGTSTSVSISGLSDNVTFNVCEFDSKLAISGSTINGLGPIFQACSIFANIAMSSTGVCSIYDSIVQTISLADSAEIEMYNCMVKSEVSGGSAAITGTSSGSSQIFNSVFYSAGGIGINATSSFLLCGNSGVFTQSSGIKNLFDTNPTISYIPTGSGNISQVTLPAGGYTVTLEDSFIGINTSAARTVNMYATPFTGLTYTISDITGSAGANNITVNGNGSNIDGAASYTIGSNYASITLVYTGTIWKVI